jgi:hypothetical protein
VTPDTDNDGGLSGSTIQRFNESRFVSVFGSGQNGPRGRTCTCNFSVLSGTPLHWATRGWCPRSDLHRHCARFKCAVSSLDYVGEMACRAEARRSGGWCRVRDFHPQPLRSERSVSCRWTNAAEMALPAGLSPATATFEASRSDTLSYGSIEIGGSPRIRTEFSPVKSRGFTVKVCNPIATRRRS